MIQPDLKLVFLCPEQSFPERFQWWLLTSTVNIQMLVTHWGLERDGQQTGSDVWTGVYTLDGMSGSLQTVKIQYSDSVLTWTVQNLIRIYVRVWVCVRVCDSPFGIVCRGSASRKVCESLLWDTQHKMVAQEEDGVQQVIFTGLQNVWCQRSHPFKALAWVWHITSTTWYVWHHLEMSPRDRKWWIMLTRVVTGLSNWPILAGT